MTNECLRCKELSQSAYEVPDEFATLTQSQLAASQAGDMSEFMALDKELELAIGKKEVWEHYESIGGSMT